MQTKGVPRRRHGKEFKVQVLAACAEPGASVAAIAQAHGLNANLVHKWRRGSVRALQGSMATTAEAEAASRSAGGVFVPLQLPSPPPMAGRPDIRIELRRGTTSVTVTWPTDAAADCATWMRELLR